MDDNRNNRQYDDFFKPVNEEEDRSSTHSGQDKHQSSDNDAYYYSYGPFRSQADNRQELEHHTGEVDQKPVIDVIPYHTETRQYDDAGKSQERTDKQPERQYRSDRKRWLGSFVAAFLCCALIMTGLAYASDVNNWFTDNSVNAANARSGDTPSGQTVAVNNGSANPNASDVVRPNAIADIVEQSSPSVVMIETYVSANRNYSGGRNNMDFFEYFFGDRIQVQPESSGEKIKSGLGSGFIFDKDGYILTNEHVVSGAEEIYVTVEGYKEPFKAELLGSDFDLDLAVLKIAGNEEFKVLPIGDSADLRVGDWVTAIGNPKGFEHTVSVGVLSGMGREIQIPEGNQTRFYDQLLQTDASINPGNSGGPLINMSGEVVGINTAVSLDAQGIGFAIPSSTIVSVLDLLKSNQSVPKPFMGVVVANIDPTWLEDLQLDSTDGAIVTQVEAGSPAARAGIRTWDVITKINDKEVKNFNDVRDFVQELGAGSRATVTIIRDGKEIEAGVIIGDRNG